MRRHAPAGCASIWLVMILPRFHTRRLLLVFPVAFLAACGGAPAPASAPAASNPLASQAAKAAGHPAGIASAPLASTSPASTGPASTGPARSETTSPAQARSTPYLLANCPVFPADNVWNTDISKLPVNAHSAAWLRSMNSGSTYLHPDFGPSGGYPYGIPYTVMTDAHPKVHVTFRYASESDRWLYPFGSDTRIEGGQSAGGDRHALMLDSSSCRLYELYNARYGSRATAGSGAIWNLRSNALRPAGWTSADAAGLPILPGLLNFAQIRRAVQTGTPIRHAIRFTADRTSAAYLWPARHQAGSGSMASLPPMGARFRLKLSFNVAGFCHSAAYCAYAKAVLTEMQHYGLILADNGSNWYFGGAAFPQWPDALVSLLKGIPASAFEAVNESCLMVSQNSGQAQAHAGCPIG
jgi:hypothetical protein